MLTNSKLLGPSFESTMVRRPLMTLIPYARRRWRCHDSKDTREATSSTDRILNNPSRLVDRHIENRSSIMTGAADYTVTVEVNTGTMSTVETKERR